jgi:starch-binding outer membrane protein, SusD/RagB family
MDSRNDRRRRVPEVLCARPVRVFLLSAGVVLAGCEVTNPGPVQTEFLAEEASHQALVNGAARQLVMAENDIVHSVSYLAREVLPGGTIGPGSAGGQIQQSGLIDDEETGGDWADIQQTRFIAEFASETLASSGGDPGLLAQARIWAGYANRVLGENFCQVAYDGGPAQDPIVALERAEGYLTEALTTAAGDRINWALAGRAQARALAGDWAGAAADAAMVPIGWEGFLETDVEPSNSSQTLNNYMYVSVEGNYRGHSVRFTLQDDYFTQTGDSRVAWATHPNFAFANSTLQGYGSVPFTRHVSKHNDREAPYRLASGDEMRLIQAEAILQQTPASWAAALALINEVRTRHVSQTTGQPLQAWAATSEAETWQALMTERAMETWLEGRRMADLRRWEAQNRPGVASQMPDFRSLSDFFAEQPSRCFPIPEVEQETNPNIEEGSCIGCG